MSRPRKLEWVLGEESKDAETEIQIGDMSMGSHGM